MGLKRARNPKGKKNGGIQSKASKGNINFGGKDNQGERAVKNREVADSGGGVA